MNRKLVAVSLACLILVAGSVSFEFLPALFRNSASKKGQAYLLDQPFASIWQKRYSGAPSTVDLPCRNNFYTMTYLSNASSSSAKWNLLAISLSSGNVTWSHVISLSGEWNTVPSLYAYSGNIFVIGYCSSLSIDNRSMGNGTFFFASGFNSTTGRLADFVNKSAGRYFLEQPGSIQISFTSGLVIYAYTELLGDVGIGAFSVVNGSGSVDWSGILSYGNGQSSYNGPVTMQANPHYIIIQAWKVFAIDTGTGAVLFSLTYSSLDAVRYNFMDGQLLGNVFYFVQENRAYNGSTVYDLVGYALQSRDISINVTIGYTGIPEYPSGVEVAGNNIIAAAGFNGPLSAYGDMQASYTVLSENGNILWNSSKEKYSFGANNVIQSGHPLVSLSGNTLLLSSISAASARGIVTQYFEKVNATSGSPIWTDMFMFHVSKGELQFVPPSLYIKPQVLILASSGQHVIYSWNNTIGCAVL
ncbi:MAG: hypothetical protein KIY11_04000 [Thermoplasmata archaeon]|nr:hypothetical protein [Candidatus Sysuiplasma acidicola]